MDQEDELSQFKVNHKSSSTYMQVTAIINNPDCETLDFGLERYKCDFLRDEGREYILWLAIAMILVIVILISIVKISRSILVDRLMIAIFRRFWYLHANNWSRN